MRVRLTKPWRRLPIGHILATREDGGGFGRGAAMLLLEQGIAEEVQDADNSSDTSDSVTPGRKRRGRPPKGIVR